MPRFGHSQAVMLYLHGFRSSPRSQKARLLEERCQERGLSHAYRCPQLPASPRDAAEELLELTHTLPPGNLTIVGSSLGGYYATWLAERIDSRVVLLNPAVRPQRDLVHHLGRQKLYYSDETVEIKREFLAELESLWVEAISRPERYFLIAAQGDELLDWREMVARYPRARQLILSGSDHGLSDFADYADLVLEFAGMTAPNEPTRAGGPMVPDEASPR